MIEIKNNSVCSQEGTIVLRPNETDPPVFGGCNPSERVDVEGNLHLGVGRDMAVISACMGNPGTARLVFDHATLFIATGNPQKDENGKMQAPTAFANVVVNNLTVKGSINIERPVFATVTSARKVLSVGEEWVTPDGYIRKLMPLT